MKTLFLNLLFGTLTLLAVSSSYAAGNPPNMPSLAIAPGGVVVFFIHAGSSNGLPSGTIARCNINTGGTSNNGLLNTSELGGPIPSSPGVGQASCSYSGDINTFCTCEVSALLQAFGGALPLPPYPAVPSH